MTHMGKKEKGKILDEFCRNAGYDKKYAIRIFGAGYDCARVAREGRKQRKKKYTSEVSVAAIKIWELPDYPCGARLQPFLIPTLESMERYKEMFVPEKIKFLLGEMSVKTLDRRLKKERHLRRLDRNRGTTRHGSLLKSSIPVRITNRDAKEVGFMEMDTVAYDGGGPSVEFIYSLDMVEIYSGWSEQYAVLGKERRGRRGSNGT